MNREIEEEKKKTTARIKRTEAYAEKVRRLFSQCVNEMLALHKKIPQLGIGEMYSFDGDSKRIQRETETLLRRMAAAATLAIEDGISVEWSKANEGCDKLLENCFGRQALKDGQYSAWRNRNTEAMNSFKSRTDSGGFNLSDKIWKTAQQLREEMEVAMTLGIGEGQSASEMSRIVRKYLNDPDLMFRRFRYKAGEKEVVDYDADGNAVGSHKEIIYGRKWKKKVKGEDGRTRWIDYDKDSYKVGRGNYKSSARNAMRVTRTETNMAYRKSDQTRWSQMDFVLGVHIEPSRSHPKKDICDKLKGDYPKDFQFDGWHPQCFCVMTPILIDEDEMAKVTQAFVEGKKYTPKGKPITDYPQNFKDWVTEHQGDIVAARERGTEPYFIRNNAQAIEEIINPSQKELSILEKAKLRHEARTPEQAEAIKNAWEERKHKHALIKKTAGNVLNVAQDYGEIDYSELQSAIDAGDLTKMQELSKTVAHHVSAMKKQEDAISDLIPDAHNWHKQFTMDELQKAHSAIESKLADLAGKSLAEQKKILEKEIKYVEDPTFLKPHTKYPTWKVVQDAYADKLKDVIYQQKIESIKSQMAAIESWSANHPKSLNVANLLAAYKSSLAAKEDVSIIQQKASLAYAEYQKRLAEQARRDAKKSGKVSSDVHLLQTDKDAYSQARKDAAIWCKSSNESDAMWGDESDTLWNSLSPEKQKAWYDYTAGSGHMNRPLRGYSGGWGWRHYKGVGNIPLDNEGGEQNIRNLREVLDTTISTQDKWLQRGIGTWDGVEGFIGVRNLTRAQLRGMVGRIVTDYSFMSCGSAKGTGFSGIILNIYCPKGSKTFYAKRHSAYKSENETFMQMGATYRITKVEAPDYGNVYIDIELIGYKDHPLL